ncbi:ADOP family duplicated permease [Vibrio gazogenes]|uniref:Duplicated orphan permease n=1 Tax=Vibrio gazogenes DSM 21264 = NBRC 103151 TaxID=1123492 RepID=A0A1M4XVI1_VIBGA|nr:ADOP family duplicated permease [Vibrio gazogenes]USP12869.1 ADOP family duplicated permease [Vibrio gazogenes]SHE97425.1 duplicated orphan permease [Vibrio gazogenes DSM 21264] [Vibrio gazogenes DSM 21264 = NBRC 103151]SJN57903.1 Macrolide export ATP-binding/permease protein MacB [Vibrio gazogenes]
MSWLFDLKYAVRLMLKRPGFTVFTMLIMACGLGLCIYMYSLINTLAFKPLSFPDGERMVMVSPSMNGIRFGDSPMSYADFKDIRDKSHRLEDIGYYYGDVANVSIDGKASHYIAIRSRSDLFAFTHTQPVMGRLFTDADTIEGANPVAVIGYELWQNYFGGRQDIIGQRVQINGIGTEIIGIMPLGYEFPMNNQIWLPSQLNEAKFTVENAPKVSVFAKLKPGIELADADVELQDIMASRASQYPEINTGRSAFTITFMDSFIGEDSKPIFLVMLLGVGFVLLLACCNVGNLLLARATERSKESAIRIAHGAPTFRLVIQMMWESTLICTLGGILGVLFAGWGLSLTNGLIRSIVPGKPAFWWELGLDADVLLKTILLVVIVSLVTGLLPAWKMTQCNINEVLRDGTRGAQSRSSGRISRILVIFEVALSCAVLSLGALLSLVVYEATKIDYGVQPQGIYTGKISLPDQYYNTPESLLTFYNRLQSDLESSPTISKAGMMSSVPGAFMVASKVELEGHQQLRSQQNLLPRANNVTVMPGTLKLLGVRLEEGRMLSLSDDQNSQKVVVITRSFAQRYWPEERHIIGKQIRWAGKDGWYTVVGIVSHVIQGRPFGYSKRMPTIYRSLMQAPVRNFSVVANSAQRENLTIPIERAVADIDTGLSVYQVKPLAQVIARNTAALTYIAILFNVFGMVAVLLAGSGIYGVMAKAISQRYQELGIRRALGATESRIIHMLMKQGWLQLLVGLLISGPIVMFAGPLITRILGHSPWSVWALFALTAAGISGVVSLATLLPALKAVRLRPMDALREQ